ncbi:MAG TPA: hypothetical protein VFH95_01275 [Candidatus Kapabacteria bacterium]|nr:hypothetical protein [Candidatus Kapabacteria bacterium]
MNGIFHGQRPLSAAEAKAFAAKQQRKTISHFFMPVQTELSSVPFGGD